MWALKYYSYEEETHLKDLETSDIQYTDEELFGCLGIQSLVGNANEPGEQLVVDGFAESTYWVCHLKKAVVDIRLLYLIQ